jgi:hypothetical protein
VRKQFNGEEEETFFEFNSERDEEEDEKPE